MLFQKYLLILLVLTATAFGADAFETRLRWEVVQPFRLLRYESDHKIHDWAYAELTDAQRQKNPVSAMEALLNDPAWWTKPRPGEHRPKIEELIELRRDVDMDPPESRDAAEVDPRLGWASLLRTNTRFEEGKVSGATCWNADLQSFRYCRSEIADIREYNQYVRPRSHLVNAWLEVSTDGVNWSSPEGECTFESSIGAIIPAPNHKEQERKSIIMSCAEKVWIRAFYNENRELKVTAFDTRGSKADDKIKVEDILIASIGDSFASGEGNPEVPARLSNLKSIQPTDEDNQGFPNGMPTRNLPHGAARWLDTRCHRSMYAAPTRAALAIALQGDRHHAVTYISYACSGAEITRGLLWPQDGVECVRGNANALRRLHYPQIGALVEALDPLARDRAPMGGLKENGKLVRLPRGDRYQTEVIDTYDKIGSQINALNGYCKTWPSRIPIKATPLLPVANFAKDRQIDILFVSIGGNDMGFAPLIANSVLNNHEKKFINWLRKAGSGALTAENAQKRIDSKLFDGRFKLLDLAIRKKLEINDPTRVFYGLYPNPTYDENKTECPDASAEGMDATTFFASNDIGAVTKVVANLNRKLKSIARAKGWTVVSGYLEDFQRHGYCAKNSKTQLRNEYMGLPVKPLQPASEWSPFRPATEYYPYASRERWLLTLNDAYLKTHLIKGIDEDILPANMKVDEIYLALRTQGGPFHPTAEGHARIADDLYCAAVGKLVKEEKLASGAC